MEFTPQEKKLITEAISVRKANLENVDKREYLAIEAIMLFVRNPFLKLTSFEKSFLRGCIKEYAIDPNDSLFMLTDYEIFSSSISRDKFEFVDTAIGVLKKFKDTEFIKYKFFSSVFDVVDRLDKIEKIYYSLSGRKVYKLGILLKGKKGIKIKIGSATFTDFKLVDLIRDQFMYEGSPAEVLKWLKAYEAESSLEENHIRVLAMLSPVFVN